MAAPKKREPRPSPDGIPHEEDGGSLEQKPQTEADSAKSTKKETCELESLRLDTAIKLATAQIAAMRSEEVSLPLDHPDYDRLFEASLRRADQLINRPKVEDPVIYAEQLFPVSLDRVTANYVHKTFISWKWPKMSSQDSFLGLMADVTGWFVNHLQKMEFAIAAEYGPEGSMEADFVEAMLQFCGSSTGLPLGGPWPEGIEILARNVRNFVQESSKKSDSLSSARAVRAIEMATERQTVRICFGDRKPTLSTNNTKGARRHYRPWGLFRYLRINGESDPSATPLLKKLSCPRSLLSPGHEPYPVVPIYDRSICDLGALQDLAEQRAFRPGPK